MRIRDSALWHHLEELKNENGVKVRREGAFLRYTANAAALQRLLTPALMSGLNRLRQVGRASTLPTSSSRFIAFLGRMSSVC